MDDVLAQEMYREHILEHYKNPMNYGMLKNPSVAHKEFNPLCGDEIEMTLTITLGSIKDVRFKGRGCAISQATASMLTQNVFGKRLVEVKKLATDDILKLIQIPLSPMRIKCALLSLDTLKNAIRIYEDYIVKNQGAS